MTTEIDLEKVSSFQREAARKAVEDAKKPAPKETTKPTESK